MDLLQRCAARLPADVLTIIASFVPPLIPPKRIQLSPTAQRDVKMIQHKKVRGKTGMFLRDLEDFLLD